MSMSKTPDGGVNIEVPVARMKITGHPPTVRVYEASAAVATTTTERDAILELGPIFTSLEEPVLHTLAHDGEPIGPRISNPGVPEPTLKALANFELERRRGEREQWRWRIERIAIPVAFLVVGYLLKGWFG